MKFVFHKMSIGKCGCCWERPEWDYVHRTFIWQIGRYLIGFRKKHFYE